ncbi:MAG TPA: transaldolase [Acidobacteriaceae bacterium]|jgi:transaldolase|nr:transaldolase [Acidobacteriaceae bacterium]
MKRIEDLRINLYSDGADLAGILEMYARPWIRGFTTNPTLMRKAGVRNYEAFARSVLRAVPDRPVSLEVFAEDEAEMERQALTIATWGRNVNVKIPVTNRAGVFLGPLIRRLGEAGVALNVTAVLTLEQVERVVDALVPETWAIVSVFAGRIADTGVDPVPLMAAAKRILRWRPRAQRLWASPRELLNVFQAEQSGCDIITVAPEILCKMDLIGKDLAVYSLETVEMFHRDAHSAAYQIDTSTLAARAERASEPGVPQDDLRGFGEIPRDVVSTGIGDLNGATGA